MSDARASLLQGTNDSSLRRDLVSSVERTSKRSEKW
jgi:hypothetical protein